MSEIRIAKSGCLALALNELGESESRQHVVKTFGCFMETAETLDEFRYKMLHSARPEGLRLFTPGRCPLGQCLSGQAMPPIWKTSACCTAGLCYDTPST